MDLYCLGCGTPTHIPAAAAWPTCRCGSTGYSTMKPEERNAAAPFEGLALPGTAVTGLAQAVAALAPNCPGPGCGKPMRRDHRLTVNGRVPWVCNSGHTVIDESEPPDSGKGMVTLTGRV